MIESKEFSFTDALGLEARTGGTCGEWKRSKLGEGLWWKTISGLAENPLYDSEGSEEDEPKEREFVLCRYSNEAAGEDWDAWLGRNLRFLFCDGYVFRRVSDSAGRSEIAVIDPRDNPVGLCPSLHEAVESALLHTLCPLCMAEDHDDGAPTDPDGKCLACHGSGRREP